MHTKICSATTIGVNAHPVDIEVDLSFGMIQFFIVGLPDAAIRESKQRIVTALKNCGFKLPERKIIVNLAPADLKKEGTLFDLPIAIGILHAAQMLALEKVFLEETLFLGELSLDGSIKSVQGVLPIAYDAAKLGKKRIIVPAGNASEAALIESLEVIGVDHLTELVGYMRKEIVLEPAKSPYTTLVQVSSPLDLSQVKGQFQGKRALQIAAAGRHNLLFIGSPGSGKTMLAQRLPTLMPPMSFDEIIETSKIYSASGKLSGTSLISQRPLRAPHHTISTAGLIGGGSFPIPGEVSLAHHGILFLDELTEFKRTTLEVLRQPLESKEVAIARAQYALTFPASFLLVAALNPCPCGYRGDKKRECTCSAQQIVHYTQKLSGPLLDRIDLQLYLPSVDYTEIQSGRPDLSSADLLQKVTRAVERQHSRFADKATYNAFMTPELIEKYCICTPAALELVKKAFDKLHLSMRGYHKLLKVARTIADLEDVDTIDRAHIQEAIMYRSLDQHREQTA